MGCGKRMCFAVILCWGCEVWPDWQVVAVSVTLGAWGVRERRAKNVGCQATKGMCWQSALMPVTKAVAAYTLQPRSSLDVYVQARS